MAFELATVVNGSEHSLSPGMSKQTDAVGFCQWVADNFDWNEDILTGHDTTHVMGIIACQTPRNADCCVKAIQHKNIKAVNIIKARNFGDLIKHYTQPNANVMKEIKFATLSTVDLPMGQYEHLDTLWLYSSLLHPTAPNWQGLM